MSGDHNSDVLVLDSDGTNLGQMPYFDAKDLAEKRNLDFVQVNKTGEMRVFKIMDRGKWQYEKKKQKQKQKQKKHTHSTKEMNFKVRIDPHDLEIKINRIKTFLSKGSDVKIIVNMRGREKSNPKMAHDIVDAILTQLEGTAHVQQRHASPSSVFVNVKPIAGKKHDSNQHKRVEEHNEEKYYEKSFQEKQEVC